MLLRTDVPCVPICASFPSVVGAQLVIQTPPDVMAPVARERQFHTSTRGAMISIPQSTAAFMAALTVRPVQ
jgi:hypothetical protein